MRVSSPLPFCALLLLLAPAARAADCTDIASATGAELRAGSAAWNEDLERLARQAAGAACVKASSPAAAGSVAVPARQRPSDSPAGSGGEDAAEASGAASSGSAQASATEDDDADSGFWPSFKRNDVSGLPGKKPYQRKER